MNRSALLFLIIGAAVAALFWKEGPALVRYIKIERM
jgi:hypothetical protein